MCCPNHAYSLEILLHGCDIIPFNYDIMWVIWCSVIVTSSGVIMTSSSVSVVISNCYLLQLLEWESQCYNSRLHVDSGRERGRQLSRKNIILIQIFLLWNSANLKMSVLVQGFLNGMVWNYDKPLLDPMIT